MNFKLNNALKVTIISGTITIISLGLIKFIYKKRKKQKKHNKYPNDVVILHQFPPNTKCPSPYPFCLKLETWLRMTNIKYQNEFTIFKRSPKGKLPWITINDVEIYDSQFCIDYLTKSFGTDLSDGLNSIEKSIARAFSKLCEQSLNWCLLIHRFKYGKSTDCEIPYLYFWFLSKKVIREAKAQGYGRHSKEEIYEIGKADLKALEKFLKNKKYLFGDYPCTEDATIFSFTTIIFYLDKGPFNQYLINNCPNLMRHFETIKSTYWPDWETRLKKA